MPHPRIMRASKMPVLRMLRQALRLLMSKVMADVNSALACTDAYTDIEEDFFRTGDEMSSTAANDSFVSEPEPQTTKASIWSRLFERPLRMPTEDFIAAPPARTRPPTEKPAVAEPEDDEWDWMLAVARARSRHATSPGF